MKKNLALLIIDVQEGFNHPSWGRRNNPKAEAAIAMLLSAWRERELPVLHVQHDSNAPDGMFRPGTVGHLAKPEALPLPQEPIYHKRVHSAFIGTRLEEDLRGKGISGLVIAGLTTNHCVSTTARMSGNLGFTTYVVEDATAAFEKTGIHDDVRTPEEVHASALSDLQGDFATIVSTTEAIQLCSRSTWQHRH